MDRDIPLKIADSFQDSVDNDYIFLYDTVHTHTVDHDPPNFPQLGNIVPGLGDKPQVPPQCAPASLRGLSRGAR